MNVTRTLFLIFLAQFLAYTPTQAIGQSSMSFTHFTVCRGSREPPCGHEAILASGSITVETPAALEKFISQLNYVPKESNRDIFFVFNSPGGNLWAGMKIGEILRKYQFSTLMQSDIDGYTIGPKERKIEESDAICASACSLAFIGGIRRISTNFNGRIGIHQFSSSNDRQIGDSRTQITMTVLSNYVEKMGVDRSFIDLASLIPPSSIHWLTAEQQIRLRVDNNVLETTGWQLVVLPDDTPAAELRLGQSRFVQFFKARGRNVMRIGFESIDPLESIKFFSTEKIFVGVDLSDYVVEFTGKFWRRGKGNFVEATVEVPAGFLTRIINAKTLNIRVGGSSLATSLIAPEGDFPMEDSAPKIRAALK